MLKQILLISSFLIAISLQAQDFTKAEIEQGYALKDQTTWFIFNAKSYKVQPKKVVVTGSFRGWSQDMNDPKWILKNTSNGVWTLAIKNPNLENIPPLTAFKYRINEGEWLSPPEIAPNEKGGNLIFLKDYTVPTVQAELRNERAIWAKIEGMKRPLDKTAYRITDAQGKVISVAQVLPNTATETLIIPAEPLNKKRVYFLEIPSERVKTFCSFDGWFRTMYSDKPLGANISADGKTTAFRVFAPRAEKMILYLYKNVKDTKANQIITMKQDADGVWEAVIKDNLKGVYYDFTVHGAADPGSHFYEVDPVHISDPYARVSMDSWGKCRVWEKTKPATPLKNGIPKMEDVIAYEVHVQDFTDRLPIEDKLKGTMSGMVKSGLKNSKGNKVGFDYLVDLGINVVHLMPIQEYMHHKKEDWEASFKDDEFMKENGVHLENYQWGYRTSHCFAVEHRYREKGTEPGAEREQFRNLVQAFHDKNIAVIIDIVPNHTAENMDGDNWNFHFNALDKLYYYRTKNFDHIGAYGNEVKTENRPMVQRWLIDQCKHFIEEFGIDGFRIDLAGQVDEQTLIALKNALGHDKIIYGEAWIGSNDPAFEANPDWDWYKNDSPITFFQDDSRNAFKGTVFDLKSKEKDRGYAGGLASERSKVKLGLINHFADDKTPISGINYLDIHDNYALADQLAEKEFNGGLGVEEGRFKIAATLLYTSLGPIVTHGGTEMMRAKGSAPEKETVKQTKAGIKVYMHGKRDTYNHRTANQFVWENAGWETYTHNYKGMYKFWQGLNRFRLSESGKSFRVNTAVSKDYYQWIEPQNEHLLGYIVDGRILVLLNVSDERLAFENVPFPAGKWKLIGNNLEFNHTKGAKGVKYYQAINGGKSMEIKMSSHGLKVWILEE